MTTNLVCGNWGTVTNVISLIGLQIANAPGAACFGLQ
jgi:hypothetical protein